MSDSRLTETAERAYALTQATASQSPPSVADSVAELQARVAVLEAALQDDPDKWSFETLLTIAELILARDYGPEVFTGASGDVGPRFVVALRESVAECRAVLAGVPKQDSGSTVGKAGETLNCSLPLDDPRHGTENGYGNLGCRCVRCRAAHSQIFRERGYTHTPARRKAYNDAYHIARAAGYSSYEARRRQFWSDPLREDSK